MDRSSDGEQSGPDAAGRAVRVSDGLDAVLKAAAGKPGPDPAGIPDLTDEDMDRFHQLIDE